jgi:hypothetical protein
MISAALLPLRQFGMNTYIAELGNDGLGDGRDQTVDDANRAEGRMARKGRSRDLEVYQISSCITRPFAPCIGRLLCASSR